MRSELSVQRARTRHCSPKALKWSLQVISIESSFSGAKKLCTSGCDFSGIMNIRFLGVTSSITLKPSGTFVCSCLRKMVEHTV